MIKKILLGLSLLLSAVSCTEDYTDWSRSQRNPQGNIASFGDGSVTAVDLIDFSELGADATDVQVCNITAPTSSDSKFSPTYKITLGNTEYSIESNGKMSVADLKSYVEDTYGKAPTEREIAATLSMWEVGTSSAVKLSSGSFKIKVKLDAPIISSAYYIVGGSLDWASSAASKEQKFTHSTSNVYDDPEFSITFKAVENGDTWFAIGSEEACDAIAKNNDWSKLLGTKMGNGKNGIDETEGMDTRENLGNEGSFCVPASYKAKYIKVTINMMDGTYKIQPMSYDTYFYEIGGESGWSTNHALYGANSDGKYEGFYYLNGEFKFKPNADNWDGDYEYASEGKLTQDGSNNIPDPGAGFYQIDVDLVSGTYALAEVKSITCVGNHNGWDQADTACHMTYNTQEGCWELTTTLKDGFKFAVNDAWDISWGGANGDPTAYGNLTVNGGKDLNVPDGEGTYKIQLYISYEGANKVVLTKQ